MTERTSEENSKPKFLGLSKRMLFLVIMSVAASIAGVISLFAFALIDREPVQIFGRNDVLVRSLPGTYMNRRDASRVRQRCSSTHHVNVRPLWRATSRRLPEASNPR